MVQLTLSLGSMVALFGSMMLLAAVPSSSVIIVVGRSVSSGFIYGAFAALGIVAGDILFILIAITGLSLLAASMGELFIWVKYLGGAYLAWVGVTMWRSGSIEKDTVKVADGSLIDSFLSGLLFTLADQKAILFYLGFFPAFIDLSILTMTDMAVIILITLLAVGGIKIAYAYMASNVVSLLTSRVRRGLNIIAGGVMIFVALFVLVSA